MIRSGILVALMLLGSMDGFAQNKAPETSKDAQIAILKASQNRDKAAAQIAGLNQQYQQIYGQLSAKQKEAEAAVEKAKEAAYKEAGVSKSEFDLDDSGMFAPVEKSKPAPAKK